MKGNFPLSDKNTADDFDSYKENEDYEYEDLDWETSFNSSDSDNFISRKEYSDKFSEKRTTSVKKLVEDYLSKKPEMYLNYKLFQSWPLCCGVKLSAVTELKGYKNGILFVSVSSSSAKTILSVSKTDIIRKYNAMFPNLQVKDLKILRDRNF